MKREMDPLKLRNAFEPMPDGCYNALMKAARSVKEEKTVKRTAFRTAVVAACIILAAMAAAVAAGSILGWNDFFKLYHNVAVPQTAQEIMAASQPESFRLGDVVFTVRERYSDAHLAMITTEAHLAEGVTGIITADARQQRCGRCAAGGGSRHDLGGGRQAAECAAIQRDGDAGGARGALRQRGVCRSAV